MLVAPGDGAGPVYGSVYGINRSATSLPPPFK
jgi:hypothetical protein